jgi:integrase
MGKPINRSNLYHREYKPLLKRVGLKDERFTFHSLRHTFASALCKKRVYPKVVQSLLGHSSITQTMDTYSHLMGGMGDDAVGGLDATYGG